MCVCICFIGELKKTLHDLFTKADLPNKEKWEDLQDLQELVRSEVKEEENISERVSNETLYGNIRFITYES